LGPFTKEAGAVILALISRKGDWPDDQSSVNWVFGIRVHMRGTGEGSLMKKSGFPEASDQVFHVFQFRQ
jgi:hypothetical protein